MEAGLSSGSAVFKNTAPPAVARPTLPLAASHFSILSQNLCKLCVAGRALTVVQVKSQVRTLDARQT